VTQPAARVAPMPVRVYPVLAVGASLLFITVESAGLHAAAIVVLLLPLAIYLVLHPAHLYAVLAVAAVSLGNLVAMTGVDLGIRIYPLDLLLGAAFVAGLVAGESEAWSRDGRGARVTQLVVGALAVYGVASLLYGLAAHHPSRDALGDFRRMFLYPILSFLAFRVFVRTLNGPRVLTHLLGIAGVILLLIFVTRLVTGRSYHEEAFAVPGEAIRYLSYAEAAGASFVALAALTATTVASRSMRPVLLGAFALSTLLVIGSNYRTAWLAFGAGLLAAGLVLGVRRPTWTVRLLGLGGVLAGLLLLAVRLSPLWSLLAEKLSLVNLLSTGSWRLFSWAKAYSVFHSHPLLGVGLGYQHEFYRFGAGFQSVYLNKGNTIHNDLLWVAVNTGLVGLALFGLFWISILWRAYRSLRKGPPSDADRRAVVVATCVGQLAVVTVTSTFQPSVSLGSVGVVLGLLAAILLVWSERVPSVAEG